MKKGALGGRVASAQGDEWKDEQREERRGGQGDERRGNQGWQELRQERGRDEAAAKEVAEMERREQKLMQFYANGGDENKIFGQHEVEYVSISDRRRAKEAIRDGVVTRRDERELLERIAPPLVTRGASEVFKRVANVSGERGLLMQGVDARRRAEMTQEEIVETFMENYPTPFEFEALQRRTEGDVARAYENPQERREAIAGHRACCERFQKKVYGARYNYYKVIQKVRGELEGEIRQDEARERQMAAAREAAQRRAVETAPTKIVRARGQVERRATREAWGPIGENHETYEVRTEVATRSVNKGELTGARGRENEDSFLERPDEGLFAVFDGVGGAVGGAQASRLAAEGVDELARRADLRTARGMREALEAVNRRIRSNGVGGMTTAVVAKLWESEEGEKYLTYASVGDSRMYLFNEKRSKLLKRFKGYEMKQLTRDEGEGRFITNALGTEDFTLSQVGTIPVRAGDRILLCSDGITGDTPEQAIDDEDMKQAMEGESAEEAVDNFQRLAKKKDDRTAQVIVVK